MSESAFACRGISHRYSGHDTEALRGVDIEIETGSLTCILGPNGAGKSTLVRILAGTLTPTAGDAEFLGKPLNAWPRTDLARRLAVVGQDQSPSIRQTVGEYVALGRNPYVSAWSPLSAHDHAVVAGSLERVGLSGLSGRDLTELSGGERQRARLARALAQEPEVLILDEPTAHLDVGHGLWAFETLRDLASRFADSLVLIADSRVRGTGAVSHVLTPEVLSAAYGCSVRVETPPGAGYVVLPESSSLVMGSAPTAADGFVPPGEIETRLPC